MNIFYTQTVYILLGILGSIAILVLPYKAFKKKKKLHLWIHACYFKLCAIVVWEIIKKIASKMEHFLS